MIRKKKQEEELLLNTKAELDAISPSKVVPPKQTTPKKSPYAFEKFASLIEKERSALNLPNHYLLLLEMFRSTETLVSMMSGRDELITLDKLKPLVQNMMKKNFDRKQLGQIKTVYPEAYNCRVLKMKEKFGQRSREERFHLVLSPNLETDLVNYNQKTPTKTPTKKPQFYLHVSPHKVVQEISPRKTPEKFLPEKKRLTVGRQVVRREIFRNGLINIVKEHHRNFLKSLDPPVELTKEEESRMQRWNPRFAAMMGKLPEVSPSELPEIPSEPKIFSAKDLLDKSKETLPEVTKRALEQSVAEKMKAESSKNIPKTKGISTGLLQKIRAKQALNEKLTQMSTPSENKRKLHLSRLPDIVRIMRNMFLTERKNSVPVPDVMNKLTDSYGQLSYVDLEEHIELLLEILPQWISRAEIPGKGAYIKIKKETKVTDLIARIEKAN